MKKYAHILLAALVVLISFGSLITYDLYFKPYVLSKSVLAIRTDRYLPKNHVLTRDDLKYVSLQNEVIPANAVYDMDEVIGKKLMIDATDGQVLTRYMVDIGNMEPGENEGIFPIPKEAIFAINGSLRVGDTVDLFLIKTQTVTSQMMFYRPEDSQPQRIEQDESGQQASLDPAFQQPAFPEFQHPEQLTPQQPEPRQQEFQQQEQQEERIAFIEGALVVHVRSEDNNDVRDTDSGDNNQRQTSTARISSPELKLDRHIGKKLIQKVQEGYQVWIVRTE